MSEEKTVETSAEIRRIVDKMRKTPRVYDLAPANSEYCDKCEFGWIIEQGRARRCSCQSMRGVGMRQEHIDALLKRHRAGMPKKLAGVSAHTFLVRPGHEHIRPALDKYIRDLKAGKRYGFYIFGKSGVGKSFAAAYVVNTIRFLRVMPAAMVNFARVLGAIKATFRYEDENRALLSVLYDTPLLAIDDLGMEQRAKENPELSWSVSEFYKVIDYRRDEELPTIVTSNRSYEDLVDRLGEPIMRRIQGLTLRLDMSESGRASVDDDGLGPDDDWGKDAGK